MTMDAVRKALAELEDEHGRLTPEAVVKAARSPKSPLHQFFEWSNVKAAEEHRLDQARTLITSVKTKYVTNHYTVKTVTYVRDPDAEPKEQGYRTLESIAKDGDDARETIAREFTAAAGHLARARQIAMALQLEEAIDDIVARLDNARGRLHPQQSPLMQ